MDENERCGVVEEFVKEHPICTTVIILAAMNLIGKIFFD